MEILLGYLDGLRNLRFASPRVHPPPLSAPAVGLGSHGIVCSKLPGREKRGIGSSGEVPKSRVLYVLTAAVSAIYHSTEKLIAVVSIPPYQLRPTLA